MKHEIKSTCSELTAAWQIKESNPPTFKVRRRTRRGNQAAPGRRQAPHLKVFGHQWDQSGQQSHVHGLGWGESAAPSIVTPFPDIGAKLGCHSLIMLTIRLNHSGKSHKIPLSTLQWLFPIPIIQHLGRFGRRRKLVSLLLMLLWKDTQSLSCVTCHMFNVDLLEVRGSLACDIYGEY